jgi:hypothetical protein
VDKRRAAGKSYWNKNKTRLQGGGGRRGVDVLTAYGLKDWTGAPPEQQKDRQAEHTAAKARASTEVSTSPKSAGKVVEMVMDTEMGVWLVVR